MRKASVLLISLLACLPLLPAGSPALELSWKSPSYIGGPFRNILVLALNGKAENRLEFEDQLVAAIRRPGLKVEPSYAFMARDVAPIHKNDLKALVREQGFDAIVVARLTKRNDKTTHVPGLAYSPMPYSRTFDGYYSTVYPVVYSPGYMKTEKIAQVEVNLYSTAKPEGELVWTGITNAFEIKSELKAIEQLVKIVVAEVEKQNIIEQDSP